ncbi:MAG: hypothetical protein DDT32_01703 [Syntrophomonadaceae bacterium]|nr:hypothetical protein [Bacillota bacterium]
MTEQAVKKYEEVRSKTRTLVLKQRREDGWGDCRLKTVDRQPKIKEVEINEKEDFQGDVGVVDGDSADVLFCGAINGYTGSKTICFR